MLEKVNEKITKLQQTLKLRDVKSVKLKFKVQHIGPLKLKILNIDKRMLKMLYLRVNKYYKLLSSR